METLPRWQREQTSPWAGWGSQCCSETHNGTDACQHGGLSTASSSWRAVFLITMTPCCSVVLAKQCRHKQTEQTWLEMFCWEWDLQASSCFFGVSDSDSGSQLSPIAWYSAIQLQGFLNPLLVQWIYTAIHCCWNQTVFPQFFLSNVRYGCWLP